MTSKPSSELVNELLQVPATFVRKNNAADLFIFYSIKNWGRVHVETKPAFDLAVQLEADPKLKKYNFCVPPQPICQVGSQNAANVVPAAVSLDHAGHLYVHTLMSRGADPEAQDAAEYMWREWCEERHCRHVRWVPGTLWANPVLLANQKRLVRFLCRAARPVSSVLMDFLAAELRAHKQLTFYKLLRSAPHQDEEDVKAAIAGLLLSGKVFSTLATEPFSLATELSAFHEISRS